MRALPGQPGALQVRAVGRQATPLPATVREVAAAADPATRTFLVKADLGNGAAAAGADRHRAGRAAAPRRA